MNKFSEAKVTIDLAEYTHLKAVEKSTRTDSIQKAIRQMAYSILIDRNRPTPDQILKNLRAEGINVIISPTDTVGPVTAEKIQVIIEDKNPEQ